MAKGLKYDGWNDPAAVYGLEELEAYDPEQWASRRVAVLCVKRQVAMRIRELQDTPKAVWWFEVGKQLRNRIGWYCQAIPLVAPTPEELGEVLPGHKSAAGKELSKVAALTDPREFLGEWGTEAEQAMFYVVTIGRAAAAHCKWDRTKNKLSNRLANCVEREVAVTQKLDKSLDSHIAHT